MKKLKAITFSFDDGVQQDKRLIDIDEKFWTGFEHFCELIAGKDDIY